MKFADALRFRLGKLIDGNVVFRCPYCGKNFSAKAEIDEKGVPIVHAHADGDCPHLDPRYSLKENKIVEFWFVMTDDEIEQMIEKAWKKCLNYYHSVEPTEDEVFRFIVDSLVDEGIEEEDAEIVVSNWMDGEV